MRPPSPYASFSTPERRAMRKKIWRLTLPVVFANITIPLVGMADTAVMGHFDSAHYIGAVAMGSFLFSLAVITFGFLRMATTGLVAQAFGAGDRRGIVLHLLRGAAIGLVLGLLVLVFAQPLILAAKAFLSASDQVLDGMALYMTIVAFAGPAACLNLVGLGLLFGLQRATSCMVQLVAINCVNISGNLLLVFGFGMKIEGVALATLAAQYTGTAVTLWLVFKAVGHPRAWPWPGQGQLFTVSAFKEYFGLGRDLTIRTFGILLGELMVLNSSASIGDVELAVSQIGFVLFGFVAYGLDGYAHAAESLVGEALGARRPTMLRAIVRDSTLMAFATSLCIGLAILLLAGNYFRVMTSLPDVLAAADTLVPWLALIPAVSVFAFQLDGVFIGATEAVIMRNAMVLSVALFLPLVYLGGAWFGLDGIWGAFLFLLALRGLTLGLRLDRVYAKAEPARA